MNGGLGSPTVSERTGRDVEEPWGVLGGWWSRATHWESCHALDAAATAAGMMLAASVSLIFEGLVLEGDHDHCIVPQWLRVLLGLVGGLLFIVSTKNVLEHHEEIKVAGLDGESVVMRGGVVPPQASQWSCVDPCWDGKQWECRIPLHSKSKW